MSALERIKGIKSYFQNQECYSGVTEVTRGQISYLLKSFEVMREIAIDESWGLGESVGNKSEMAMEIDQEFNDRMKADELLNGPHLI